MSYRLRFRRMTDSPGVPKIVEWTLAAICSGVATGLFVVGLWPFHAPKNEVAWLGDRDGLRFGSYGIVLGARPSAARPTNGDPSCSVEIWLQPGLISDTNTFLAFYTPERPLQFTLHQYDEVLSLESNSRNRSEREHTAALRLPRVFRRSTPIFITVASGKGHTAVYIDGTRAAESATFEVRREFFAGQLVVGDSPVSSSSWSGELRGLALYAQELTAEQVKRHYRTWTKDGRPNLGTDEAPAGLYLFRERTGDVIHSEVPGGPHLTIPRLYTGVERTLLDPPSWNDLKDLGVNVAGFIPFGLVLYSYFSLTRGALRSAVLAVGAGAIVSLAIEILQYYLPTRDSDMTDVITNTAGTLLGVLVCWGIFRHPKVRRIAARVSQRRPEEP